MRAAISRRCCIVAYLIVVVPRAAESVGGMPVHVSSERVGGKGGEGGGEPASEGRAWLHLEIVEGDVRGVVSEEGVKGVAP